MKLTLKEFSKNIAKHLGSHESIELVSKGVKYKVIAVKEHNTDNPFLKEARRGATPCQCCGTFVWPKP